MGTKQKILNIDRVWLLQDIQTQLLSWIIFAVFLCLIFGCLLHFYYIHIYTIYIHYIHTISTVGPSAVFRQFSKQCKPVGEFWCLLHPNPVD